MAEKTIIRKGKGKADPFARIDRKALHDNDLSWKGTGLLCYILSLPDDWVISIEDLRKRKKDGRDSTATALRELVKAGYAIREVSRDSDGRFLRFEYAIHEEPQSKKRGMGRVIHATETEVVLREKRQYERQSPIEKLGDALAESRNWEPDNASAS